MRQSWFLGTLVALVIASVHPPAMAGPGNSTTKDWSRDLDALLAELEAKHPNPYHTTSRTVLEAQVRAYRKALPRMSQAERVAGMARLLAMIGDGHTWMPMHALPFEGLPKGPGFRSLPVRFELFDDGLFVVGAMESSLLGKRVVAIGDVGVAEAIARTMEILPQDATNFAQELTAEWLMQAELLVALGLSETAETVRLTLTDGSTQTTATLSPLPDGAVYDWIYSMDSGPLGSDGTWRIAASGVPVWQTPMDAPNRLIPDVGGSAYLQVLNIGDAAEPFAETAARAVAAGEALDAPALILDLRRCLGGDGSKNAGFMKALTASESLSSEGRIRVLISRQTHSAAIMLLSDLQAQTSAVLFGQAAADRPNHYGETNVWTTPNTQLPIIHASEYYATAGEGDTRRHHLPDIHIPYRFIDYAAGRDPVLDAALTYAPPP
jgi:hypothetical protein